MHRLLVASLVLVTIALGTVAAGAPDRADDLRVSAFSVAIEFDGMAPAFFSSVEGLSMETTVVEYRDGGSNEFTRKLPGVRKWPNIVLKQGFDGHPSALQLWALRLAAGAIERKDAVITLYGAQGEVLSTYRIHNAWPTKWTGPALNRDSNEVAVETIEIAHDGFVLVPIPTPIPRANP
jgi:phage tail-like protein